MGSGTMKCKGYRTGKGYYLDKDFNSKLGGEFYFLLLPLYGNNGERFFYVTEDKDDYIVEGECYIISDKAKVSKEVRAFRKNLRKSLFGIITKIVKDGF